MNKLQWNFNQNPYFFIQENAFEDVGCQNGGHFAQGEMSCTWMISIKFKYVIFKLIFVNDG